MCYSCDRDILANLNVSIVNIPDATHTISIWSALTKPTVLAAKTLTTVAITIKLTHLEMRPNVISFLDEMAFIPILFF